MERDEIKHQQIMRRIEVQIKKETALAETRRQRFMEIQKRLKDEMREHANNVG
jgi:hypothetical protein